MDEGPRNTGTSPDDHGALLAMTTWFLACALIPCITSRVGVHFWTKNLPNVDDWFIFAAAVLAVGETIAVSLAVGSGLGRTITLLNYVNVEDLQRSTYAATILYVLTVGLSKLSICAFLFRLSCAPKHKTRVLLLSILVTCWTIAITVGVIFQCALPHPWRVITGRCISTLPFWVASTAIDIVGDMIMVILPIFVISSLQLSVQKKAIAIFIFSLRVILIVLSILRLVYLQYALKNTNRSFDSIPFYTLTQAHAIFSVIIACSPALKPFMDQVRTGMLSISLEKHCPNTYANNMQEATAEPATPKSKRDSEKSEPRKDEYGSLYATSKSPWESQTSGPRSDAYNSLYTRPSEVANLPMIYISDPQENGVRPYIPEPPPSQSASTASRAGYPVKCPPALPTTTPRSRTQARPSRPPPPPEELRPDMSVFTVRRHERANNVLGGGGGVGGMRVDRVGVAESRYGNAWAGSEAAMRGREKVTELFGRRGLGNMI